jgi:ubiquinone/menaquinone biosynthesis C-methylase UbiE
MTAARHAPNAGSIRFKPLVLFIYDFYVIRFSAPLIWRVSPQNYLRPLFTNNFSKRHLDIGVGNGYFPIKAIEDLKRKPEEQHLTLVDLSEHALISARQRILSHYPQTDICCVLADAAKPPPASLADKRFDSASLSLVLHHMPGPTLTKAEAIRHAKGLLTDNGVLIGSTVLGKQWEKTEKGCKVKDEKPVGRLASFALGFYNKRGIMDNLQEDPNVLEKVLQEEFEEVETQVVAMMFLWRAAKPRKQAGK